MSEYEGAYTNTLGVCTGTIPLDTWVHTPPISYKLYVPPKPVGYWIIDPHSTYSFNTFAMYSKPTDDQIKNTETLLGWGWKDYDRS